MRKGAVNTGFDLYSVLYFYPEIAGTVRPVKRTVAKKTVDLFKSLVTRIILTFPVFEKPA